jgi:hypothetical protein
MFSRPACGAKTEGDTTLNIKGRVPFSSVRPLGIELGQAAREGSGLALAGPTQGLHLALRLFDLLFQTGNASIAFGTARTGGIRRNLRVFLFLARHPCREYFTNRVEGKALNNCLLVRSTMKTKNLFLLAVGMIVIVQSTACKQKQGNTTTPLTAYFDIGHLEILDVSDANVANVDFGSSKPGSADVKALGQPVPLLKLRLKLTGDKTGSLTLQANQLCVETTNGESRCGWLAAKFFANAFATSNKVGIGAAMFLVDGKAISLRAFDPDTQELRFDLKPGESTEAELIFNGLHKSQASSFHFGAIAVINLK